MKTIVTGEINAGKTTTLIKHYEKLKQGDGFASVKVMAGTQVHHYDAMKLSTGERKMLVVHENYLEPSMGIKDSIGPYRLLKRTAQWIEQSIKQMIAHDVSPIYFDEIGPLELSGKGFDQTIKAFVKHPYVIVVRQQCIHEAIRRYNMRDASIIDVSKKGVR